MWSPGRRLITQNLLVSAREWETEESLTFSGFQDFCTFVDLFCLYDDLIVLGRQAYSQYPRGNSDFFSALDGVVTVEELEPTPNLIRAACQRLAHFLVTSEKAGSYESEETFAQRYSPFFDAIMTKKAIEETFSLKPDTLSELKRGEERIRALHADKDTAEGVKDVMKIHRGVVYLGRTFLYLAYANVKEVTLTPDTVRTPVTDAILKKESEYFFGNKESEHMLRKTVRERMRTAFQNPGIGDSFAQTHDVTPLAAIVINRASPHRKNIVKEMIELRRRLVGLREAMRATEAIHGNYDRNVNAVESANWNAVFNKIDEDFGGWKKQVSGVAGIDFATKAIGSALSGFNLKDVVESVGKLVPRLLVPAPIAELHRLSGRAYEGNLRRRTEALFGKIVFSR